MIRKLSDNELRSILIRKAREERELTAEIIEHIREVNRRKLHEKWGHGSLVRYCVHELKYSETSARLRISAMYLVAEVPEATEAVIDGRLNLSNLAAAQSAFRQAEREDKFCTTEEKREILTQIENLSEYQARSVFADKFDIQAKPEKSRAVAGGGREITVHYSKSMMEKYEKLRALFSHIDPSASHAELLEMVFDAVIAAKDPAREPKIKRKAQPQRLNTAQKIPAATRRAVFQRAESKCEYLDKETGQRCNSTHLPEVDHIIPRAHGGTNDLENLRLLCDSHNQYERIRKFGDRKYGKSQSRNRRTENRGPNGSRHG